MGTLLARLTDVTVAYGARRVLDRLSLDVVRGRQLAVLGASGAGKSTLLKVLTRQLTPLAGSADFPDGHPPREGVVHQDPLLLPWATVAENIALGQAFAANRRDPDRIAELVDLLGLAPIVDSYPDEISGGQAQRVSLARALAISPDLLLLDEPFSALDPAIRAELQGWLRAASVREGLTSVIVTHDIDEALILADDIVLISPGGRLSHRWTNHSPATSAAAALVHPLRSAIWAGYGGGVADLAAGDEEFSGTAVRHG